MVYDFYSQESEAIGQELWHHGIEGQEWGVRNGPPYPLDKNVSKQIKQQKREADKQFKKADKRAKQGRRDDVYREKHTIPAGTTMYRVTATKDANADGMTYVTYLTPDRLRYRAGWIREIGGTGKAYEHRFDLKKDLVVPSREELEDVCKKVLRKDQANIDKTVWGWMDYRTNGKAKQEIANIAAEKGQSQRQVLDQLLKDVKQQYVGYAYLWVAQSFGTNVDVKKQVISELKKRGYNAMVDEAGVGGHARWSPDGVDPLIIFNGSDVLEEKGMSKVSRLSENVALDKTLKWGNNAYWWRDKRQAGAWSAL